VSSTQIKVNLEIFPLPIVESALYALSERIDGRIGEIKDGRVSVALTAVEQGLDFAEMERALHRALIAASVNERAFQMAAPIRNYLAQTAFSITTQNQQTIEEFAASVAEDQGQEHAGAPTQTADDSPPEDDPFAATAFDNGILVDAGNGQVVLRINPHRYLLPDVLWAANEMRDVCDCSIDNLRRDQLTVQLKRRQDDVDLTTLGQNFERWLEVAVERGR
jgi:hypothetical protein